MKIAWSKMAVMAALFACMVLMWRSLWGFGNACPAISLRWPEPLNTQQIDAIAEEGAQARCSATFWREEQGSAKTETGEADAAAVRYQGDRSLIQRLVFLEGTEREGAGNENGIISAGLAFALWGSTDVVGQRFSWKGETFSVAAVFQGSEKVLFLPQPGGASFDCLELRFEGTGSPVAAVSDLLAAAGVEDCRGAVYGPEMKTLLEVLTWLPLAACGVWGGVRLAKLFPLRSKWARRGLLWGGLILLAVLLPLGIRLLPGWLTPPQWSDFDFWTGLVQAGARRITEWLRICPMTKDVQAKRLLLYWASGWAGSLFCLNWLCYRVGK